MGGLGNQFFQYAFGRSIELEYGYKVIFETSWFDTYKGDGVVLPRAKVLDRFYCQYQEVKEDFLFQDFGNW